jgi:hypothetical protein
VEVGPQVPGESASAMAKRIFERKRRQMPCTLKLDGRNHGGLILDLSPGGLYIQSSAKIKPGDQVEIQMTIPGIEGRHQLQVEVVRKVVVPARLLKVARGGVGVRIINAPEAYYQFMDELGVTADSGTSKIQRLEDRRPRSAAAPQVAEATPEPKAGPKAGSRAAPEPKAGPKAGARAAPDSKAEPPAAQAQYRVRIKQSQGPRSRTLSIGADSEDDARNQALHAAGAGWVVLGVERVDAD